MMIKQPGFSALQQSVLGVHMQNESSFEHNVERLLGRISFDFNEYLVPQEALSELEFVPYDDKGNPDDERIMVHEILNVVSWRDLRSVSLPKDGTVLPYLTPPKTFIAMLPLFMTVTLRDLVDSQNDRLFLDSFIHRLTMSSMIGADAVCTCLTSAQCKTLETFLHFISTECYGVEDVPERDGISKFVTALGNERQDKQE